MSWSMFPFWLQCNILDGRSEPAFRDLFAAKKPKDLTWYAYDVCVLSPDLVEFVVFDMLDGVEGGVGNEIARFQATSPVPQPFINWRARKRAEEVRRDELLQIEEDAISAHMTAILASMTGTVDEG